MYSIHTVLKILVGILIITFQLNFCVAQNSISIPRPDPFKKWSHQMILGAGMEVKWDGEDRNYLTMEMSAPTRGYLGIGFSPNGGMAGADIVLGWIDSRGVPFIMDCHAITQGPPISDLQQDYELVAAEERENRTTITFRRRWDTCDEKDDMAVGTDTVRLIWAYHFDDPVTHPFLHHHYHGPITRGVRSAYMRTRSSIMRFPDDRFTGERNVLNWDVAVRNVRVSGKKTSYVCKIVKFPRPEKKHHMIGFRPIISPGNAGNIHHISVYFCQLPQDSGGAIRAFESYLQMPEQECYSHFAPQDWVHYCSTFLFAWGIGSEGEMLPSHVGIPLGQGSSDQTYFKIEVHYDNPIGKSFTDSSGVRIFYTENLRKYDATTLFLGHRVTPFQMIPQSQNNFMTFSFCSKECTRQGISSPSGLKIISVLLHGHLAARRIRLRHIRNGRELPPIAEDNSYDFKYQQFRILSKEVVVLPGDELIVECNYDTSERSQTTFGGFSTQEEMCQAIVLYYPRTNISDCRSQPELYSFFNAFGIDNVTGELLTKLDLPYNRASVPMDLNLFGSIEILPPDNSFLLMEGNGFESENPFDFLQITSPLQRNGMTVGEYMRKMDWRDQKMISRLEDSWKNGYHYMFCSQPGHRRIPVKNRMVPYPTFENYQEFRRPECRGGYPGKSLGSSEHGNSLAVTGHCVLQIFVVFVILKY